MSEQSAWEKARRPGIELAKKLVVRLNGTPDTNEDEWSLVVDCEAIMRSDNNVRFWELWPEADGTWSHTQSGEMHHPLSEVLQSIAGCYTDRAAMDGLTLDPALDSRPLRVETYRRVRGRSTQHFEYRWRVVHTSNGETMASGEGYVDGRDRDHAVEVLFPGVEVVEVEG